MISAALTHLLFPSQEVKDLCFVCFQNLCVHAMLSCCVLRCAFFLLIFQRGLENDICLQRITRKPTHGQRPPLLLYQTHIWWRKDPKWKIPSILVSVGLTHLVNYFQVVLELWEEKKTPCWDQIFSADYVGRLPWTARESAHTGISDKSDGIESDLETQQMKVT